MILPFRFQDEQHAASFSFFLQRAAL